MDPIKIANLTVAGRQVDVEIQLDPVLPAAQSVYLIAVQTAGGPIQRFSAQGELIRVHTPQPHGINGYRHVVIEGSQATEANGIWRTIHVTPSEFTLRGSKFKGNVSAGNGTWILAAKYEIKLRAEPTSPTSYVVSLVVSHPGIFSLTALFNPVTGPPLQSTAVVVTVS